MIRPALSLAVLMSLAAAPALAAGIETSSSVPGLAITPLTELPTAPKEQGEADFCSHLLIEPSSAGGQLAGKAGWGVTGEIEIGDLTLVSFVGGYEAGTSGSCLLKDGNVGVFKGSDLVAVAYAKDPDTTTIGRIAPFGESGARIWDGDFLQTPLADMTVGEADVISIGALASEEQFCGGKAIVPAIYDKPIGEARDLLLAEGWTPVVAPAPEGAGGYRDDLVKAGVTEVTDCSGTGFGYCSFEYKSAAGTLSVTTVGDPTPPETPTVSAYDVSCGAIAH